MDKFKEVLSILEFVKHCTSSIVHMNKWNTNGMLDEFREQDKRNATWHIQCAIILVKK